MNDAPTLASAAHQAARPRTRAGQAEAVRRRYSFATLRSILASERERTRFRWELRQMAKDNPHLIDDIGLTKRQVEDEIAKLPFWQR